MLISGNILAGGPSRRGFGKLLAGAALARNGAAAVPPPPKLTVLVLVEQLRPDYLDGMLEQFSAGGLRRLLAEGAYYPDCRHRASTFTSSTIATLATGAWPSQHGIVADSWYDHAARRRVAASEEALLATTLAGEIAAAPRRRAFVAGMDPAATRLFAGSAAAAGLYWMDERGQFAARGHTPDWLAAYNRQKPLENLHDARWMAMAARSSAPPMRTLTYRADRPEEFLALYRSSPFAQMAQFEFLAELIGREQLGQGSTTDFVCLLLGSTARLGYETGAHSPLMQQMVLHLDRHIEFLLATLSRILGEGGFNVVLAGAHGAPPAPAPETRARMAVNGESLAQAVQKALGAQGPRVEKYVYPFLFLDPAGARDMEAARLAAARAAAALPQVASFYTAGGASPASGEFRARFENSFHSQRSGDVMLSYRPEYVEEFGAGRGVSYGSLYNYDVRAPLCCFGPQFRPLEAERSIASVDLAPTLARALGVAAPSSAVGRVLGEAFAQTVKSKK